VGEVIRRITGRSLGRFFAEEVAGPLGLDLWIGLPESAETRVAPIKFASLSSNQDPSEFQRVAMADTHSLQALSMFNLGGLDYNSRLCHAAEIGAAGGIGNARAICGMFTPLANGGGGLVSRTRIDAMRAPSSQSERDATFLIPSRFGQGFMLSMDNRAVLPGEGRSFIIGDGAFGHVGAGGSAGFADPDRRMAFSYVMNRLGNEFLLNTRGQRLIDAAYDRL
jgi:CubicO group peptidase (beta-lactamase class C family)